jgi:IrrE N-terminal-like domain
MDGPINLHQLTDLVPRRALDHQEAAMLAEIQANKLLRLGGVTEPPVPVRQLIERTGIVVEHDPAVEKLGQARPGEDGRWHLRYPDPAAPDLSATLAHLFKIILDQPFGDALYPPLEVATTGVRRHYIAEYFAVSLTIPHGWVVQYWQQGERDIRQLARLFGTSRETMRFRLRALRLITPDAVLPAVRPAVDTIPS